MSLGVGGGWGRRPARPRYFRSCAPTPIRSRAGAGVGAGVRGGVEWVGGRMGG